MAHFQIISLLFLLLFVWVWLDGLKAQEMGVEAVRKVCEEEGLQLLDETISRISMTPSRNDRGRWFWLRVYRFEYSDTGNNRLRGSVHVLGQKVVLLNVGLRLVN